MYDTKVNRVLGDNQNGKALAAIGSTMVQLGEQKERRTQTSNTDKYRASVLKLQENQDKRAAAQFETNQAKDKVIIDKALKDEKTKIELENSLIKAYEMKHPKYMGKLTPDGKENDQYKDFSRTDKLALIEIIGKEQSNKKTPTVKNVYTAEDGKKIAVYTNGSTTVLPYNAKVDWNKGKDKSVSKEAPYGLNKDGSIKTAKQFGEEQTKLRILSKKEVKKIGNIKL